MNKNMKSKEKILEEVFNTKEALDACPPLLPIQRHFVYVAMKNYTEQKLLQHGVMQAEASELSEGAAVGKEREAKGVSVELTEDDLKWLHQKPIDPDWIKGYDRA